MSRVEKKIKRASMFVCVCLLLPSLFVFFSFVLRTSLLPSASFSLSFASKREGASLFALSQTAEIGIVDE